MRPPLALPPQAPDALFGRATYDTIRCLGGSFVTEVVLAVARGPRGFARPVALKRVGATVGEADRARGCAALTREAAAYARLSHPAIVRLFDFVEDRGRLTLVLEHVDGLTLAQVLAGLRARDHVLGDACAYYVGYRVFLALAAAHAARDSLTREFAPVIHRDVCPTNVLVPWDGYVKLTDFGVARLSGVLSDTKPGQVKGTLGYLAPEQARGEPVTVRTDVYAACLVLRELLTGASAFPRDGVGEAELLARLSSPDLVALSVIRPDVPARLAAAMDRGLAADAERRDLTAEEMVFVLRGLVDVEDARARLVERLSLLRGGEGASGRVVTPTRPSLFDESAPELDLDTAETRPMGAAAPAPDDDEPAAPYASTTMPTSRRRVEPVPLEPGAAAPPRAPIAFVPARFPTEAAPRARRGGLALALVGAALLSGAAIFGALAWSARPRSSPHVAIRPARRPRLVPPRVVAAPRPEPRADASAAPAVSATTGLLVTDAREAGHRLFVDGRVLAAGAPVAVRCGTHEVRVGSAGRLRKLTVPCGGSVHVAP